MSDKWKVAADRMSEYRRIELDAAHQPRIVHRPLPTVDSGQVRIRIAHCSVNRADLERIKGSYGGVAASAFAGDADGAAVPGYEPSGTVEEVGPGVDSSVTGARVLLHSHSSCGTCRFCVSGRDNLCARVRVLSANTPGLGGWSEQLVVPAKDVLVLPETIELAPACTLEVTYGTAWGSLELGRGIVGDEAVVAVRGVPGGVALAVAQLCHLWEVPVAGIVRDLDSSRVLATKARLPWLPLVSEQQAREGALKDVLGARPNMVVDPLGGDYIAHDIDLVDRGGAVAVIGAHLGAESSVRWDKVFSKAVAIYGVARAPSAVMQRVVESVADGSVKPLVDKIFAFSDIDRAVAYAENPDGIGRVLLRMESVEDRDAGG